ncbi:MAG: molybdate ABC transporter substrate-binding protein [Sedimenticolaceae bacterium]
MNNSFPQTFIAMTTPLRIVRLAIALALGGILFGGPTAPLQAAEVKVAVAANFTAPMKEIARQFATDTGHQAIVSYGSTGKLYAQILHGAPFDVFLAADQERPALIEQAATGSSRFTYATGRLVLWSSDPGLLDGTADALDSTDIERLAIANPKTAPYGIGAVQIIEALQLGKRLENKIVRGDNIAQTYQFVMTGNAQAGFVALSQVADDTKGSRWIPPQSMYDPIRQDAILLAPGNTTAEAFIAYLKGDSAKETIRRYGYAVD